MRTLHCVKCEEEIGKAMKPTRILVVLLLTILGSASNVLGQQCVPSPTSRECAVVVSPDRAFFVSVAPERLCVLPIAPSKSCVMPVAPERLCVSPVAPQRSCAFPVAPPKMCVGVVNPERLCQFPVAPERLCTRYVGGTYQQKCR
jgi:hypothetical protein